MTTNEIIEGNRIIDKFNDDVLYKCGWLDFEMNYHKDWNNLMPVISKCLEGEAEVDETTSDTIIGNIYEGIHNQHIEHVFRSVIKFIKWYNEQGRSIKQT